MPDSSIIAALGLFSGAVQIAAIGLLTNAIDWSDWGGGFMPPRSDKPHIRRRRDDETLLVIGAL